jgi:hypothetical protein
LFDPNSIVLIAMRKVISFILSFLFPLTFNAQPLETATDGGPRHELGMNLFSITNVYPGKFPLSNITSSGSYYKTGYNVFPGIYYRFYSGKNALRISFDYSQKAYSDMERVTIDEYMSYDYSYAGIKINHDLKFGYQRSFGMKRVQPFIFSDLVFNYDKFTGVQNNYWLSSGFSPIPVSSSSAFYIEQYLFGIAPGGGVRIKVSKNIVLTYELSAIFSYSRRHETVRDSKSWTSEIEWRFNPIKMFGFGITF